MSLMNLQLFPFCISSTPLLTYTRVLQMRLVDREAVLELLWHGREIYAAVLQSATLRHWGCQQKV